MRSCFVVPSGWLATNQRVPSGAVVISLVIGRHPLALRVFHLSSGLPAAAGDGSDASLSIHRILRFSAFSPYTVDRGQTVTSVTLGQFQALKAAAMVAPGVLPASRFHILLQRS